MELQQIIVIAIVCLCTIWISIRIFQYFKRIKNNSNPCECCSSDCAMKSMQNKPKYGCKKISEKGWNEGILYQNRKVELEDVKLTLVPYCYWGNRENGEMLVWMKELFYM